MANSADGRWLLLGTGSEGVGLYDTSRGVWAARQFLGRDEANPSSSNTIVWWQDRFWIGGPNGLTTLIPDPDRPRLGSVPKRKAR
ncbi:MAG: hypothetical protein HC822_03805 [Oscillochloris sp.]|nr:hypothetical protein [Oscillochloris sp.]